MTEAEDALSPHRQRSGCPRKIIRIAAHPRRLAAPIGSISKLSPMRRTPSPRTKHGPTKSASRVRAAIGATISAMLPLALAACAALDGGTSDAEHADEYRNAVDSLPHVSSVESTYKTNAGMGRTADVLIQADTNDEALLEELMTSAFPAIVEAAEGDPEVSLYIQVIAADGQDALGPESLGYSGTGTLTSYREFLTSHPIP